MKRCKYCQNELNSGVKFCSNCGKKQNNFPWFIIIIGVIFIIAVVIVVLIKVSFLKRDKFTYTITKEYTNTTNKIHHVIGTVTNIDTRDYAIMIRFVCYDKSGNVLGIAEDVTEILLADRTWKFDAQLYSDTYPYNCEFYEINYVPIKP